MSSNLFEEKERYYSLDNGERIGLRDLMRIPFNSPRRARLIRQNVHINQAFQLIDQGMTYRQVIRELLVKELNMDDLYKALKGIGGNTPVPVVKIDHKRTGKHVLSGLFSEEKETTPQKQTKATPALNFDALCLKILCLSNPKKDKMVMARKLWPGLSDRQIYDKVTA